MADDLASEKPGPMGWGVKEWSEEKTHAEEQRVFDELAEAVPMRVRRHAPKEPNAELLAKVKQIQQANGIDGGFCFLYLAEAVFGHQLQWLAQLIGSCVPSGDMRTTAYRMLAEVFLLNDPEELPGIDITGEDSLAFFAPYNYRAGRKIGGLNGGDGSFCSAHIKGKMQYGHVPCSTSGLNADTLPEPQSTSSYRTWGNSNQLLEQFAPIGKKFPLIESEKLNLAGDAKTLLVEHYKPANICSSWGFAPSHKHPTWKLADGSAVWIYKRSGSWAHNMSVIGCVEVNGDWMIVIENSWGMRAHKNGSWFAVPIELFHTWLRSADCQSVGEIDMTDNPPAWPES